MRHRHISAKIKAARQYRNITQEQLAEKSGLVRQHISDIERGRIRSPTAESIQKIAEATRIKMEWFVRGVDFIGEEKRLKRKTTLVQ